MSNTKTDEIGKEAGTQRVLVCQGRSCRKYGSFKVLEAFLADLVPGVEIIGSGCLGQCGNGPMVLVEGDWAKPTQRDRIWYWRVRPDEVPIIIERHLRQAHPLVKMLYPKFHH
ncbi:MAG: (2Fe-2S) ferredoxin domain-containing protein [Hydrococcus sp. Prado102]|nr:(2Fe-2S) ferredoxin domain-containing protein [Hydrococcus sp. Prado102]